MSVLERMCSAREHLVRLYVCADDDWTVQVARTALAELDRAIAQALIDAHRAVLS